METPAQLLTPAQPSRFTYEWFLTVSPLSSNSIWTPTLTSLGLDPTGAVITLISMFIHFSTPVPPGTKLLRLLTLDQVSIIASDTRDKNKGRTGSRRFCLKHRLTQFKFHNKSPYLH